jgi:hypothetical protein
MNCNAGLGGAPTPTTFPGQAKSCKHKPPERHCTNDAYSVRRVDATDLEKRFHGPAGRKHNTRLDAKEQQRRDDYSGADWCHDDNENHEECRMSTANHTMPMLTRLSRHRVSHKLLLKDDG